MTPHPPTAATTRRAPEGWQLVPVEPTREMRDAAQISSGQWYAALTAAPATTDVAGVESLPTVEEIAVMFFERRGGGDGSIIKDKPLWSECLADAEAALALLARGGR